MSTKVSVIVPIYNVSPYLKKCLESLCNQTLSDIEIIAVDDKSTDNSLDLLKSFAKKDSRITVIPHKVRQKTATTRNDGLKIAKGEYVAFVDGDDYLDLDFLANLYKLAKKEDSDIAKGLTKTHEINGKTYIASDNTEIRKTGKFAFMGHLLSAIYKRKMLLDHNIFFHVDFFCFQIQSVYYANTISCIDNTYYNYVRHEGSCDSETFSLNKWLSLNIGHANFIYEWINNHNYDEKARELYLSKVKDLYFYGFNKLAKEDILKGCYLLADVISENYDCGLNISDKKRLRRLLFLKNKHANIFELTKNILKGLL